jgi:TatD DNase family protein
MTPQLIDSHSHIHFPGYDEDRADVLARMKNLGVWSVTIGTTLGTSRGAIACAEANEGIWATVGYHPEHFTSTYEYQGEEDKGIYSIADLKQIAQSSKKVVAIGETGLDFFRIDEGTNIEEGKTKQENGFREQIHLAKELDLPVVIHCRDALTRLAEIIQEEKDAGWDVRGVVHCYTGTWEEAQPLIELGLHLSFTGIVTFPVKKTDDPEKRVHRVIERMPLDRMMIETDAPFLTPIPHRGERNEPVYVEFVARKIAELRGISYEEVAQHTTENAKQLFRI